MLVKAIVEVFCDRWAPGAVILGIRDTKRNVVHLNAKALATLGVTLDSAARIPDIIVHYRARNWLLLIEAVTSAGPVDGKRRKELKDLFAGCKAGLVFVTAFENRRTMHCSNWPIRARGLLRSGASGQGTVLHEAPGQNGEKGRSRTSITEPDNVERSFARPESRSL